MNSLSLLLGTHVVLVGLLLIHSSLAAEDRSCNHPDCYLYATKMAAAIDWSVDPCDDFYRFACGRWQKKAKNSEHSGIIDRFAGLRITQRNRLEELLLYKTISNEEKAMRKASTAFSSCLYIDQYQNTYFDKLRETVNSLGGWYLGTEKKASFSDMIHLIKKSYAMRDPKVPFRLQISPTESKRSFYYAYLIDPYPNDYITSTFSGITADHIATIASFIFGRDEKKAREDAQRLLKLKDDLDKLKVPYSYMRPYVKDYKPSAKFDFMEVINEIFDGIKKFGPTDTVAVYHAKYFENFFTFIEDPANATIVHNYMILEPILTHLKLMGNALPTTLRSITPLSYLSPLTSRAEHCLPFVEKCYAYAIANKYGKEYHNISAEIQILQEMTHRLIRVFEQRLQKLDWLDEPSRAAAIKKLRAIKDFYEYPEWAGDVKQINDFHDEAEANYMDLVGNAQSCERHLRRNELRVLLGPSENLMWISPPLDVNAFYLTTKNHILILEGYIASPLFNIHLLRAMNYGLLGTMIGHELTHGFDTTGVKYDENGDDKNWLSLSSQKKFDEKAQCLINQYSNFTLTEKDLFGTPNRYDFDGKKTISENIADFGGMVLSYFGYKDWVANNYQEELPEILSQNFTADQVYFLARAQMRCAKYVRDYEWMLKSTHSPHKIRIMGPMINFPEFAEAFKCSKGSPMAKENACSMW